MKRCTAAFFSILLITVLLGGCTRTVRKLVTPVEDLPFGDPEPYKTHLLESFHTALDSLSSRTEYHISLVVSDDLASVKGEARLMAVNTSGKDISRIPLYFLPNFYGPFVTVQSVSIDGEYVAFPVDAYRVLLNVDLPEPLAPGEKVRADITYDISVPEGYGVGYGALQALPDTLSLAYAYPVIPAFLEEYSTEPVRHGDITATEASFFLVEIEAPGDLQLVGSGSVISSRVKGDRGITRFAAAMVRDFYVAGSRSWVKVDRLHGDVLVSSYAPADSQEGSHRVLDQSIYSLSLFEEILGPYPYTRFNAVSLPITALGIEFPCIIVNSSDLYSLNERVQGIPASILLESTTAHEVAHQWFYGLIGNDQLREPWIDEGMAQFLTWYYYRERYGAEASDQVEDSFISRWNRIAGEQIPIGKSVDQYTTREYGAVLYGLAPLFFMEAMELMGEEVFFSILSSLAEETLWEMAEGDEILSFFEENCECTFSEVTGKWF